MQYTLKKSLGQHFLHDEEVCQKIVEQVTNKGIKNLLEIGPGGGAITKYLLDLDFQNYQCIEIDTEKVEYLLQTYPILENRIQEIDFLKASLPFEENFTVIGNFPYNISTQIVFKILEWRHEVDTMIGMFQKEVAQRIASKHGNKQYGILSVLTQCFYDVEYLFDVQATCFTPPPNVVSGVIKCTLNNNPYNIQDYPKFKSFVKACFGQRRKTLSNSVKSYGTPIVLPEEYKSKRAEQLSPQEFAMIFNQNMV
jgi:16S rRNA (adenine1518-N6/adenine1519-N6)-dimethyltransferase